MGATSSAQAATVVTYNNILNTPPAECPAHQPGFKGGTAPPRAESATQRSPQPTQDGWVSECPAAQADGSYKIPASTGECPVQHGNKIDFDYRNMMPPPNQRPAPDQPFPLETGRVVSSIPKSGDEGNWVYPSPQMFWNAMLRKGWRWKDEQLDPNDMRHIINIHNANNEQAWEEILKWEALHYREGIAPKLKSFRGKAQEPSPRARLRGFLGYEMPFDRHDWVIEREGRDVRYIIDYYDGGKVNKTNFQFTLLDVRPALDSPQAIWDRMKVTWWRWTSSAKDTPAEHAVDHASQPETEK